MSVQIINPKITVIIGVNQWSDYVPLAINSILKQSYKNIELIVVANGRYSDLIENNIKSYFFSNIGERIKILKTPVAQLAGALNFGLSFATGEYIARMDADDISKPDRLSRQIEYLLSNKLDLVGSQLMCIDIYGKELEPQNYPVEKKKIDKLLPFKNCFAHNSILCKKDLLLNLRGYLGGFNTEDYDLWLRMRRIGVDWGNMDEELVYYRVHEESTQRSFLSYAEVCAHIFREFIITKNPIFLFALPLHLLRLLVRAR